MKTHHKQGEMELQCKLSNQNVKP